MGHYSIVPQTRSIKGDVIAVDCKLVKVFPRIDEKTGEQTGWMRLVEPFLQVLLADNRNPTGLPIKVKERQRLNGHNTVDIENPPLLVVESDMWYNPPIQRESAKPKPKPKKSEVLPFASVELGHAYLIGTFGRAIADTIREVMDATLAEENAKAEAKAAKAEAKFVKAEARAAKRIAKALKKALKKAA